MSNKKEIASVTIFDAYFQLNFKDGTVLDLEKGVITWLNTAINRKSGRADFDGGCKACEGPAPVPQYDLQKAAGENFTIEVKPFLIREN